MSVGLLASPMGFVLSGKFLTGENPKARLSLFPQYSRYSSEQSLAATKLYMKLLLKWFDSNRVSACFYSNLFNEVRLLEQQH
jgi:hypothetical protein